MTETSTTRVPAPKGAQYSRARVARAIGLAGAGLAAGLYFAVFPVAKFGVFNRLEIVVIAFLVAGALCAAGVALAGGRARARALRAPLVLPLLALAVWSLAWTPAAEFPWRSLLGPPQTGQGVLAAFVWAAIAAAIAAFAGPRARGVLAWLSAAGALAAALTHLLPEPWRPFEVPGYFAWLGIAACAALAAQGAPRACMAGVAVLLLSLAVAENRTAIGTVAAVGGSAYFAARAWRHTPWLRPAGAIACVILAPLATVAVWVAGDLGAAASIEARARIYDVMFAAFADRPAALLFGFGWGGSVEAFFRHLPSGAALLYGETWDVPVRDFHSVHNLAFEYWVSAGIPGLTLALALPALIVARARTRDLPLAIGFGAVFAVLSVLWHQQSFNLGPTVVAMALLARRPWRATISPLGRAGTRALWTAGAATVAGAALWLAQYGWRAHAALARDVPQTCLADFPADPGRGDLGLRYALYGHTQPILLGRKPPGGARTAALVCAVDRDLATRPSLHLALASVLYRSEAFAVPALLPEGAGFAALAVDWPKTLAVLLDQAPRRTDLAIPYLAYLATQEAWATMGVFADSIRARRPNDPVGLWFSGLALLRGGGDGTRDAALSRLRTALDLGLERFLPLPDNVSNSLK
jgi:hypothetical protein